MMMMRQSLYHWSVAWCPSNWRCLDVGEVNEPCTNVLCAALMFHQPPSGPQANQERQVVCDADWHLNWIYDQRSIMHRKIDAPPAWRISSSPQLRYLHTYWLYSTYKSFIARSVDGCIYLNILEISAVAAARGACTCVIVERDVCQQSDISQLSRPFGYFICLHMTLSIFILSTSASLFVSHSYSPSFATCYM